ncbi:MAG: FecR domain-containing protein [Chloroflexi bacterium]|nr:FecR domain-containing protein [Chloroflexota bacterium]
MIRPHRSTLSLLIILSAFTACVTRPATQSATPAPPPAGTPTLAPSQPSNHPATAPRSDSEAGTTQPPNRAASIAEIVNTVQSRESAESQWANASIGQTLAVGGEVQTLSDGEARIDISPDTIVRIGPNTHFALTELAGTDYGPLTRLTLAVGEIWVALNSALNGGSFEVETPVGSASVRGSYISVDYDAVSDSLIVSCLEGSCILRNEFGLVDLIAGQETFITRRGLPPEAPRPMDPDRLERWQRFMREARPLIEPVRTQLAPLWVEPAFIATRAAQMTLVPRPRLLTPGFIETLAAERTPIIERTPLITLAPGVIRTRRP